MARGLAAERLALRMTPCRAAERPRAAVRPPSETPGESAAFAWLHHAAHVAHAGHASAGTSLLGRLGDDRLGREDVLRDRRGVLQRRARDHRRVDDPGLDQVLDLAVLDVQAVALGGLADLIDDDGALEPRVVRELAE